MTVPCTGLTERSCPHHGNCTCKPDKTPRYDDIDWHCPLHGHQSQHALNQGPE